MFANQHGPEAGPRYSDFGVSEVVLSDETAATLEARRLWAWSVVSISKILRAGICRIKCRIIVQRPGCGPGRRNLLPRVAYAVTVTCGCI